MYISPVVKKFVLCLVIFGLTACGGGGGSDDDTNTTTTTTTTTTSRSVSGGGVKGPLANAIVTVYAFDSTKTGFKGAAVATATTDASAAIVGLALPFPVSPPYILEFTSDAGTTDITTGIAPVITTMRTVITQTLLDSQQQIYATPLTTMAVDMAIANSSVPSTAAELESALTTAASQVVSTLGFGMDGSINIFDTPPLIDGTTTSTQAQADVAAYRTAVEAVTAIAFQMSQQTAGANTDSVLADLSANLADNGTIDATPGTAINSNTLQVLEQDPATLPIPNEPGGKTVGQVQAILVAETATTGTTTSTTELGAGGSITTTQEPAQTDPDLDGDGTLNADDAFPNDGGEDIDTDGDGIGDNTDPDDDNNGILDVDEGLTPAPITNDADLDGVVNDGTDNCPVIFNPSQTNTDAQADGGDACDTDDDDDAEPDATDAFPLDASEQTDTDNDGLGNNVADSDDDNDGVADGSDTGVAPAGAPSVGVACSLLRDCDGDGVLDGTDFDPVNATITFNFAPIASSSSVETDEDQAGDATLAVTDDGVAAGALTYNILTGPSQGSLSGTAPDLVYTPSGDYSGADSFTFNAQDAGGAQSATATVSITVNPINDAPVIAQGISVTATMSEDGVPTTFTAVTPTIIASDSDSTTLIWSGTAATNGTATVTGTGASPVITYVPTPNFNGSDNFDVTVSDGNGGSDTITVNVTVEPVNDAPTATTPTLTVEEDSATPGTSQISVIDADIGDTYFYVVKTDGAKGNALVSASGLVSYTPNTLDYNGADSVVVTVSDSANPAGTVDVTIVVDVTAVNDAPTATAPTLTVAEDSATPGTSQISVIDADSGDTHTYALKTGGTKGAASVDAAGLVSYTPNTLDYNGADSIVVTVSDSANPAGTVDVTIVVDVTAANDAPTATAPTLTVAEDSATPGTSQISVIDVDSSDTHTYALKTDGTKGTASVDAAGLVSYTPNTLDYNGADSVVVTVSDSANPAGTVDVTIVVDVTAVNDAPTATAPTLTVAEDSATPGTSQISVIDADSGDTHTYALKTGGTKGAASVDAAGLVSYTPNTLDYNGADSIVVTVSDSANPAGTVDVTIVVDVTAANDAPTATAPTLTVAEDSATPGTSQISVIDVDSSDTHTYEVKTDGTKGTASVDAAGLVSYTPNTLDYNGADSVVVTVSDSANPAGMVDVTIVVDVTAVNDDPVAGDDTVSLLPDVVQDITAQLLSNDNDVEGATPTVTAVTATTSGGNVSVNAGVVTFNSTGLVDGNGTSFDYTISDGELTATATVTVNITANQAPVADDGTLTVAEDSTGNGGTLTALDPESDAITYVIASSPPNGDATITDSNTGAYSYTPDAEFSGEDSFTFTASDATGTSIAATITITVTAANDAPTATAPTLTVAEDSATPGTSQISVIDADSGDTHTYEVKTQGAEGTASVDAGGVVSYTPATADYFGADSVVVTVSDSANPAATVDVTITVDVTAVNDAPVATDDSETTLQNVLVIVDVLTNDSDVENDTLTVAAGDAANGIVTLNNDETFDYVPNPDYIGSDSFTYTVSDGNGGSDIGTVTITVNPLGAAATVANLLDETQGGGVGAVESWNETLPQFEHWRDSYDATAGTLSFIDEEYDYDTELFVDVSGFDSLWLTSIGTWELPSSIDVVTPNDGDGSMVVAVRNAGDTENVANFRIRAFTQDIDGDLISDYLDANWAAQMLNPAATFGAGAQLVTSYTFESLTDSYSFELEDWCEFEEPARYAALGNSCNGVYINTSSSYATTLAELQVSIAWTDTDDFDDSLLDTVSVSYDGSSNSELLAELVVAGNVVNFYVRDYDLAGVDYIIQQAQTSSWSLDSVSGVMMIRFTIPAALQSQFPDLSDEGGLTPFFTEFGGFVRGGVLEATGSISGDDNILNGIALDEVLANFDAPAAPDVTELIGSWVSDAVSSNGDPTVFHYFSSFNYEVSGTCEDGSIGLEYGTMTVNVGDGTFTTSTTVNGRGNCSLANVAGPGTTLSVSGDTLTLDISGQVSTFSRLKGDLSPLVGSWVAGDITMGGDGGHVLLTFFDDGTYMHSEDCSNDGVVGTEYGPYLWDEGGTNQVTTSQVYDANGVDPGCGLSENTVGDWELVVTGDTLTVTVPLDGSFVFTRHSPALVPITPPIAFADPASTTLYNVELDDTTGGWVMQVIQFDGAGGVTVDVGGPTEDAGTYEVIGGILEITGSLDLVDYIMIMSADTASGADRVCWTDPYADLVNCSQPGSAFLFADQGAANTFLAARIAGATFSGSAVNASTVFAASGLFMLELDNYYDAGADAWIDTELFFELTANGTTATDDEYLLIDGSWVLSTDTVDIALTNTGWKANVDWRFDTSAIVDPAVTLSNVEVGETLNSLTATFSEMAIDGDSIIDYVDAELAVGLINGTFTAGAKVYETSITVNNDYYYINDWGSDCGTDYNGNCNVAQLRTLDRITGDLTGFTVATDTSFVGTDTLTIELGWNGSMSLIAVFASGGVLEFWQVDWSGGSQAIYSSGNDGIWSQSPNFNGTGETLVFYEVPAIFQNSYQVQGDADSPAVFLSQQNSYVRFGEKEDEAGLTDTVYFFNDVAFQDINNNIPGIPALP